MNVAYTLTTLEAAALRVARIKAEIKELERQLAVEEAEYRIMARGAIAKIERRSKAFNRRSK